MYFNWNSLVLIWDILQRYRVIPECLIALHFCNRTYLNVCSNPCQNISWVLFWACGSTCWWEVCKYTIETFHKKRIWWSHFVSIKIRCQFCYQSRRFSEIEYWKIVIDIYKPTRIVWGKFERMSQKSTGKCMCLVRKIVGNN